MGGQKLPMRMGGRFCITPKHQVAFPLCVVNLTPILMGKETKQETSSANEVFCPWCGTKAINSLDECAKCGKSLHPKTGFMYTTITCRECQREIENPRFFCPHCGVNLNMGSAQFVPSNERKGSSEIGLSALALFLYIFGGALYAGFFILLLKFLGPWGIVIGFAVFLLIISMIFDKDK